MLVMARNIEACHARREGVLGNSVFRGIHPSGGKVD